MFSMLSSRSSAELAVAFSAVLCAAAAGTAAETARTAVKASAANFFFMFILHVVVMMSPHIMFLVLCLFLP